ncbi:MAG TPA: SDR family NAD(P)-dependent oxidoreductase [Methylomirabilota bacterium]|nr:SDR family NAD(P)-dependent oxidoreductase [Methylomirabilota bacterium]
MGLQNKVALVTGGSGGLGRTLALYFVRAGCSVVITSRNLNSLTIAAQELSSKGVAVTAWPCDIKQNEQVAALRDKILQKIGTVQILVNGAGLAKAASFLATDDGLWSETLEINLTGTYHCCKAFLPGMIAAGWGRIINIASTTAKVAYSHIAAYTSSKHGVLGLNRALALETARLGITVNAICPGYLNTERTRENAQQMAQKTGKSAREILDLFARSSPQKRLIEPAEVASLALLLASESMGGMTGQAINVDGGAVMA